MHALYGAVYMMHCLWDHWDWTSHLWVERMFMPATQPLIHLRTVFSPA
jgi:hypothetical protein